MIEIAKINGTNPLELLMKLSSGKKIDELLLGVAAELAKGPLCPFSLDSPGRLATVLLGA